MKEILKGFFPHFFVTVFFVLVAVAYFSPVLQGKTIYQSDIALYKGMAKEQEDFRANYDEEPYWTNSAFAGMPTYQLGARFPNHFVKKLDQTLRFLPRPADYLFLYFMGFYLCMLCLKVDYRLAVLGALAFGFSTYMIIILGVGHNAKAHALAYLPLLLGGIILTFRKKYTWGFAVTALAMALEIQANHYQMTYYFMFLVLILGLVYLIHAIRKKQLLHFTKATGILVLAVIIGLAANAGPLLATKEYADWSIRGPSALTLDPQGNPKENKNGLDKAYITNWSYGITESLNLWVPRLFGGASIEDLGEDSKSYKFLIDQGISRSQALRFAGELPLYWGDQPSTSGPAYVGAIILFLFLLGLLLVKSKAKWWLLGGFVLSLLLSWGKNFGLLTDLMIDYFPLYDKFRAVSSAQVILELCAPILAVLALKSVIEDKITQSEKLKALMISSVVFAGMGLLLLLFKGSFDFVGSRDELYLQYYGEELVSLIQRDREAVYTNDLLRSLMFIGLAAIVLWLFIKKKIKQTPVIAILALLIVVDLVGVDLRYVNKSDFVSKRRMNKPFAETNADKQILQDTGYYRVFNMSEGLESSRTSYFHKSLGGYHAARPARLSDLFDYQVYQGNQQILDMLNTRYFIQQDENGQSIAIPNPNALGNAWFVEEVIEVSSADEAIDQLDAIDLSREAVLNTSDFTPLNRNEFRVDSTAAIRLTAYQPNHLIYESTNEFAGIAVFSEMYYPKGWNAYVDGEKQPHFRVNYALRAMRIPEGKHQIDFKFEPEVVAQGSLISMIGSLGILVAFILAFGLAYFRKQQ